MWLAGLLKGGGVWSCWGPNEVSSSVVWKLGNYLGQIVLRK